MVIYLQEEFVLQEDLSVSDGNDVGWDVSRDITGLGFDNWKSGQGTSAQVVGDLGCTFQKTRVEVEDITGVGLNRSVNIC